jgi:AbrB family looped-hinge helix DNA binding protein
MRTFPSRISSKGQVVIPADLRREHGLKPGSAVVFEQDDDGRIILAPCNYQRIYKLRGCLAGQKPSLVDQLQDDRRQERDREERKAR